MVKDKRLWKVQGIVSKVINVALRNRGREWKVKQK
jgi:hypothetical protein